MSDPIDMNALGLRPREQQVMRWAMWARTQVRNGHYLCSPGQVAAAKRMIGRKFLTKVSRKQSGLVSFTGEPDDWLVIKITKGNVDRMRAALGETNR